MLFSVIIPVYNCKAFLNATVCCIQKSGLWDHEILLIDDGSVDGTAELCDKLTAENTDIRCVHQRNAGVSAARNRGIEEAQGEYILFFDADDAVDAGALQNAAQTALREKPDMLIFGLSFDYYFRNRLYRREELVYPKAGLLNRKQWCAAFSELYQYNTLSPVWNKFIRRALLVENQIRFHGKLIEMEDFVFSVDCLTCCDTVYLLPEAIYRYRQTEQERNTYNRLCRIESLTAYMIPFEDCIHAVEQEAKRQGTEVCVLGSVVKQIYTSFFYERIRYAFPTEIQIAAQDMLRGQYADVIADADPKIFHMLQEERYYRVWLRNSMSRVRHWLAVRVKYLLSYRRT